MRRDKLDKLFALETCEKDASNGYGSARHFLQPRPLSGRRRAGSKRERASLALRPLAGTGRLSRGHSARRLSTGLSSAKLANYSQSAINQHATMEVELVAKKGRLGDGWYPARQSFSLSFALVGTLLLKLVRCASQPPERFVLSLSLALFFASVPSRWPIINARCTFFSGSHYHRGSSHIVRLLCGFICAKFAAITVTV